LRDVIFTVIDKCDPVHRCDFDLRRYMKPEL